MSFERFLWPDTAVGDAEAGLLLGGCATRELARTYGTPLYVLDEATVRSSADAFTSALRRHYPAPASVHYASKALLNSAVAQLIAACGLGLDCVSLGELAIARRAGLDLQSVHLHGNVKPAAELEQAIAWGAGRIMVDSLDELEVLDGLSRNGEPQAILLRLNPGIDVHTHAHIQTGQLDSKFGLPIATGMAEAAVRCALDLPGVRLVGLHMHLGSQISALEPLRQGVEALFDFAAAMHRRYGWQMEEWSPGGGLAVPYTADDPRPSVETYVRLVAAATVDAAERRGLALPRMVIEPGRSLIARAMVALYSVVSVKDIPGVRRFVAVDGGMGDNIRPALYDARYSVVRADTLAAAPAEQTTVVGRYCESGDVLLRDVALPRLEAGALLAVPMVGAYTLSMASNYNLVPRPALVLVRDGQAHLIQRRETLDDLATRDLPLPSRP